MNKIVIILLVLGLSACGPTFKQGETTFCPTTPYPEFTQQIENKDNATNAYIVDKANVAILMDNLNKLKGYSTKLRDVDIPCYQKQVKK